MPLIGLTSHETEQGFLYIYQGLKQLSDTLNLNLEFNPVFIMQDALTALLNAALKNFPDVQVLMCSSMLKKI